MADIQYTEYVFWVFLYFENAGFYYSLLEIASQCLKYVFKLKNDRMWHINNIV